MDSSQVPESFRSLLLRNRGRTGLVQQDLAGRAGVSRRSVQDWEAGATLPSAERLQGVIRALLAAGGLTRGQELSEAREMWTAAEREGLRMHAPFDQQWFASLLATKELSESAPEGHAERPTGAAEPTFRFAPRGARAQDWGEAPDTTGFVGRVAELALLQRWVLEERRRLVAVLGMGGIGKTSMAARLAQTVAPNFERVYWRSLRNAPPVSDWLAAVIGFLSDQRVIPPASESERITTLLEIFRARRCLLVLDNAETLLEPGQREARYRQGMDGYGRVLQVIGETSHLSCLVLTSREAPPELALVPGAGALELHGLGVTEAQVLLADKRMNGDTQSWNRLVDRYGGNGLALKIVGETIRQVYGGDVGAFLTDAVANSGAVFGGIRRLLDVQLERLSAAEHEVLRQLAVQREPVSLEELSRDMAPNKSRRTVVEAIETLRRRSLLERTDQGASFTLQSMVLEYVTDRLVETAADEITQGEAVLLVELPLIKAQAKEYVRQTQERLIGVPILQRVEARHSKDGAERRLLAFLEGWRGRPAAEQGYGPGNVVNLLRLLRGELRGMDLSNLAIRQAYLALVEIQGGSLAGADLAETMLAEAFSEQHSISISADGALLAAGSSTGEVWLWRLADRTPLFGLPAHTGMVWSVALSADGELLVSAGDDGLLRLWETKTGRSLATLHGHIGGIWAAALSTDGRTVASGGADGTVQVWESTTGRQLLKLQGHAGLVWRVALSADGGLVASAGSDGTVRLWETSSGHSVATFHGHTGLVVAVAICADGHVLASGGVDGTVRLWDAASGHPVATLHGHTGAVWHIALSRDGALLASAGEDGTVRLWDTATGRPVMTLLGHTNEVVGVAMSGDGQLIASSGGDTAVRLWDIRTGQQLTALHGNPMVISDVALSADGQVFATKGSRGPRLWDTATGRALTTPQGRIEGVWRVALSADGQLLAGGYGDGTVSLWETRTGRQLATVRGHTGGIWSIAMSADGGVLASGGADEVVRLWEASTLRPLAVLEGHKSRVWRVALSANGQLVASGSDDGTARLWTASTGKPLATLRAHTGGVLGVALSADGEVLATSGVDGTLRLWETSSNRNVATLKGHASLVSQVALSADGKVLASGGFDGFVRLWDTSTHRLLTTIHAAVGRVYALALSADGRVLVSGSTQGMVRVWQAQSGTCLRSLQEEPRYAGLDITGVSGVTEAQRAALLSLGAIELPA